MDSIWARSDMVFCGSFFFYHHPDLQSIHSYSPRFTVWWGSRETLRFQLEVWSERSCVVVCYGRDRRNIRRQINISIRSDMRGSATRGYLPTGWTRCLDQYLSDMGCVFNLYMIYIFNYTNWIVWPLVISIGPVNITIYGTFLYH